MEREMECLVEALIKMLGKSNERVNDLTRRVVQLEEIVRESVLQDYKSEPIKEVHAALTN
ncbi:hypothetical protein [Cytobacillus massiliigabonensis]|uniref:hypothetical protein n=1 Tax=Cytobacillus massiliigabonensis TaxID=1871011 RepID=UPI000C8201A1|nr:hypothetical protein [Cytobacillus massiliigabonensis]